MSGARLQSVGQVRGAFPYINYKRFTNQFLVVSGAPAVITPVLSPIDEADDVPFDYGPDKAGRVFVVINGFSVIVSGSAYLAADRLIGDLVFRDVGGARHHLHSFGDSLIGFAVNSNRVIVPKTPLFSNKPGTIGILEWTNIGSIITAAANQLMTVNLNIGYYNDYAEYDFNKLGECKYHDHERALVDMTPV